MDPRVVYPSGNPKRVNRFAFVIHPLSKEFLKKDKAVDMLWPASRRRPFWMRSKK
jgi:hypothetical protein